MGQNLPEINVAMGVGSNRRGRLAQRKTDAAAA
jgi:hypothetical protein